LETKNKISATNLNLWGKVIDQTSTRQNFTIVLKGLAKKGIGEHIEELVAEEYGHTDIVTTQSWLVKLLYGCYSGVVTSAIQIAKDENYTIQYEYSESAVLVHCIANT